MEIGQRLLSRALRHALTRLLPAFSSNLVRRISVLKPTRGASTRRTAIGVGVAAAIAATGVGSTALRGDAQVSAAPNPGPFAASRPDLAFLGPNEALIVVIHPDELARRTELAPAHAALEAMLEAQLGELKLVDGAPMLKIRLADVDYVAYAARPAPAEPDEARDADQVKAASFEWGCDVAVRFVAATDVQLWASQNVPDLQLVRDGDFSYLVSKGDPGARMYLAQRDANTLIMSNSTERLRRLVTEKGLAETEGAAGFAEQWASVDGGVATLAASREALNAIGSPVAFDDGFGAAVGQMAVGMLGIAVEPGKPNPIEIAIQTIGEGTNAVCMGVDFDAASGLSVRVAASCPNYGTAKKVRESFALLQEVAKAYLNAIREAGVAAQVPAQDQMGLDAYVLVLTMFGEANTDFRLREPNNVDVWLEAKGELPESLRTALATAKFTVDDNVQPVAAEEEAVAEEPHAVNAEAAPAE